MNSPGQLRKLKADLVVQCEADRQMFDNALIELDRRTSWAQLAIVGASILAPKLKILIPVVSMAAPYLMKTRIKSIEPAVAKTKAAAALEIALKGFSLLKGYKALRRS